jgi:hypothetical protein
MVCIKMPGKTSYLDSETSLGIGESPSKVIRLSLSKIREKPQNPRACHQFTAKTLRRQPYHAYPKQLG